MQNIYLRSTKQKAYCLLVPKNLPTRHIFNLHQIAAMILRGFLTGGYFQKGFLLGNLLLLISM